MPLGLGFGDENLPGCEGARGSSENRSLGCLGLCRERGESLPRRGRGGVPCVVGPGPSPWKRHGGGRTGPAPRLCVGPAPGQRTSPPRRLSASPHPAAPLRLAVSPPGAGPAGLLGAQVLRAWRLTGARRRTPWVGGVGAGSPTPPAFRRHASRMVLPRTHSAHLGLGFRLHPERGHGWAAGVPGPVAARGGGRGWGRESESSARSRPPSRVAGAEALEEAGTGPEGPGGDGAGWGEASGAWRLGPGAP